VSKHLATTSATSSLLEAKLSRAEKAKAWFRPVHLVKTFAKQLSGRYIVETYLVDRKARPAGRSACRRRLLPSEQPLARLRPSKRHTS
jgi:hypothetical protein